MLRRRECWLGIGETGRKEESEVAEATDEVELPLLPDGGFAIAAGGSENVESIVENEVRFPGISVDGPGVDGVLVTLVDVPLIGAAAVRTLLERAAVSAAPVVRAVHQGRHGHPVIFKRHLFDALRRADPAAGAKAVVRAVQVEDVETGDPGVVEDVDTPEEYARLFGTAPVNRRAPNP